MPGKNKGTGKGKDPNTTIVTNRRARYDYAIDDTIEVGLVSPAPR